MQNKDFTDYFNDIADSCKDISNFIDNVTYADFEKDKKTINAVLKSLEIIGEATRNIPESVRIKYPNIRWKRMVGMRDRLVHDYTGVDLEIVWKTASEDIPKLKEELDKII